MNKLIKYIGMGIALKIGYEIGAILWETGLTSGSVMMYRNNKRFNKYVNDKGMNEHAQWAAKLIDESNKLDLKTDKALPGLDISFKTKKEAQEAIEKWQDHLTRHGHISYGYILDQSASIDVIDSEKYKYGWTDIDFLEIVKEINGGWRVTFPLCYKLEQYK